MKLKQSKYFFVTLISLFFYSAKCQNDVINTVKGENIICTIVREDSTKVYFKVGGNISSIEASLERSQITSIQYAPKKDSRAQTLSVSPKQAERDDYVSPTSSALPTATTAPVKPPKKVNSISISVGLSSPTGKFKSEKTDTNAIGPALNGQVAGVGFTHLFKPHFGFSLNGFYSNNELNSGPITQRYKNNTDSIWTAEKAYWRSFGINFGLFYNQNINEDLSFFMKVNAGYLSLKYPDLKLTMNSNTYLQFQTVTADAISFGGGIGASYKIFESISIICEVSYLQATSKYNEILITGETLGTPVTNKVSITKRDVKQTYQTIFTSIGLNYWF